MGPFQPGFNGFLQADRKLVGVLLLKSNSKALSCVKSSFLSLSLSFLSLCFICSSGHDVHQPFQPACLLKPQKCSQNDCRLFSWLLSYAKHPSQGEKNTLVTTAVLYHCAEWATTPRRLSTKREFLLLLFFFPFCYLSVCSLFASFHHAMAHYFLFAELPYGWEEIDDPQYGTYYVE